jgi:hypothetical protein
MLILSFYVVPQNVAPFFGMNSVLCNKVHTSSAKCTEEMMYDLFANEVDVSSECNYIDSLRYGSYDSKGNLATSSASYSSWSAPATVSQQSALGVIIGICLLFIIYACYIHHSMTNLLIKSMSHRELLPPSRSKRSRSRGSRGSGRRYDKEEDACDWEKGELA